MAGLSPIQTWVASFQQPMLNLIDNPWRRSTIPQFILDTRHPWILENQRALERLPDAEAFLCGFESSGTSSSETGLEMPPDLFDSLEVNNIRAGISRPGWPNALQRLGEMNRCPRALAQVKKFEVEIFVYESKYSPTVMKILELREPPKDLFDLFGDVLESMTNLQVLDWKIPKETTHLFGDYFTSRKLVLPSIKELRSGPHSHYLVSMCPELEILRSGGGSEWYHGYLPNRIDWHLALIKAAASAPKLKRFGMVGGHDGWTTELAAEAIKSMPQITSLGLHGALGHMPYYGASLGLDYNELAQEGILKQILNVVTGFENLTHLDLPSSSSLGLGFDGGPGCGNAYFGKRGREYRREVMKEGAEATERGAAVVLATMPHLESFTIGGTMATIHRGENGIVNATWPWTGRMREWQMSHILEKSDYRD